MPGASCRAISFRVATSNKVYGTMVAWPRIMFAPERRARAEWHWFRLRMTISLVVGLALHASAIIAR